eukprot:3844194-Rhodomonas_salina.4
MQQNSQVRRGTYVNRCTSRLASSCTNSQHFPGLQILTHLFGSPVVSPTSTCQQPQRDRASNAAVLQERLP